MMKIRIEIPTEFESHFWQDSFKDSLQRVLCDLKTPEIPIVLSGRYERELIEMLLVSFQHAIVEEVYDNE